MLKEQNEGYGNNEINENIEPKFKYIPKKRTDIISAPTNTKKYKYYSDNFKSKKKKKDKNEEKLDISEEDNKTDENLIPFIYNPSLIEVITKSTDINFEELTKRKRNRPKIEVINNNPIFNNINNNENEEKEKKVNIEINIEIKPEVKNKATKRGRHKKGKSSGQDAKHNKFKADNIIRKIKTKIFQYIFKLLNNSLKHTNRRFLPLNKKLHDNLKRDLNLKLLESKIYEIYENSELNNRQIKYGNPNKKLIHKIFEEKIETKAITILNMTLNEMLNYIRK